MINCRSCNHEIAEDADPCPQCGAKAPNLHKSQKEHKASIRRLGFFFVVIGIAGPIVGIANGTMGWGAYVLSTIFLLLGVAFIKEG